MDENQICTACNTILGKGSYFCPHCGKKLQDTQITLGEQIKVYLLSILFPPFGLLPGIKLMLRREEKAKMVGLIVIFLTIISFIVTILALQAVLNSVTQTVTQQLDSYPNMNY